MQPATKVGSMVTALPGNPPAAIFTNSQPIVHQTPIVTSVPLANGQTFITTPANGHLTNPQQTFVANGHPVLANVQVCYYHI